MPRHPDPDLENRILNAAQTLWKRGGEKSLTMRAVARAAGTNTPAVYRRFKDRQDLLRGLLRRIAALIREHFEAGETVEEMAEAYVEYALRLPHEYELFYSYVHELSPPKGPGRPRVRRRITRTWRWRCGRRCTVRLCCCFRNRFRAGMRRSYARPAGPR